MHFSDIIGNQGSNNFWRYFLFLHWQSLFLQPLGTLLIFFFWSVNCANQVYKLFVIFWQCQDTQTFYILVSISLDIHRNIIFNCLLLFFIYICWSVNCLSWVSKFHNVFFWEAPKLRQDLYFRVWSIMLYGKFISNFPVLLQFLLSGPWIVQETFSATMLVSKLYKLNLRVI